MARTRRGSLKNVLLVHEIAFLFLVAVTGLLSGAYIYYWQRTSTEAIRLNNLIYLTEQIRGQLFQQLQEVMRARILEDPEALRTYSDYSRRIGRDFNQLRQNSAARDENEAIQVMQVTYREIQRDMNGVLEDPYEVGIDVHVRLLDPRFGQAMVDRFENGRLPLKTLLESKQEALALTRDRWTRFAPFAFPAFFVVALLIVFRTARVLRTDFVRPMAVVKEGASVISRGRLEHRIPVEGVQEVADIAESINLMAGHLSATRDALIQSERQAALGALIPVVAHNIRNPLASIRATVQVLDGNEGREEVLETRAAVIDTIDRLGRWVNALVSYLHPLKPDYRRTPVSKLIDAALVVLKPKLDLKQLRVVRDDRDSAVEVLVDPDLMEQAVTGLVANAIEASPAGSEICIACLRTGDQLQVQICDSGAGMPFQPTAGNLEPGPSTKRFGTGLGIPIAFKICEAHGWDLEFRSGNGAGTTVVISAPVAGAAA